MNSNGNNKLSDHPIIVILGIISACIAIFAFVTGFQSIRQIFTDINMGTDNNGQKSEPFTPIPYAEPTPVEIVSGNWTQVGLPSDTISDIEIVSDSVIYASTWGFQHGVFKTNDGGKQWIAINNGLGNLDVYEIALMNGSLLAATDNSIWASRDSGDSWQAIALEYPESNLAILSVSTTTSTIYMAGDMNYGGYMSRDFGNTWQEIEYTVNNEAIFWNVSLQHVTTTENTVYIAGYENIYRSNDDGATWSRVAHVGANYNISDIIVNPSNSSIIYACTGIRDVDHNGISFSAGNGLYISKDSGGSWLPINNGLPNQGNETECTKISVNPNNTSQIYVGMNGQVYISENNGTSWKQLSVLPSDIGSVTALAVSEQKVCIGTNENGIWCILH